MLGRFLELSVATDDIRTSVEFYERLGFTQCVTSDVWPHPYGALTDGRLVIGLHQHRKDEIYYVLGGRGVYELDGTAQAVQAGDAMLTRPGSTHAIRQDGEEDLVLLIMYGKEQE